MSIEFALYDALVSIDVPTDKARAVIDALEHDMGSTLATKQDFVLVKQDIVLMKQDIQFLRQEMQERFNRFEERSTADLELLRSSMTVRLGLIQVVVMGLLFAALKLT